jgi:hypothetical protein
VDIFLIKLYINEKEVTTLSRDYDPCTSNKEEQQKFLECSKNQIDQYFQSKFKCVTHGVMGMLNHSDVKRCQSEEEAYEMLATFKEFFYEIPSELNALGCTIPCTQTSYDLNLSPYHKNTYLDKAIRPGNDLYLSVSYKSSLVEEIVETYVYDLGSFLAQAGGHLGLCLGFSCLSVIVGLVNYLKMKFTFQK